MDYPTPDHLDGIPVWGNYLFGQLVTASMSLISPRIALAGLKFEGTVVTLHFRVDAPVVEDYPEIREIVDQFQDLTGWILDVSVSIQEWVPTKDERGVSWSYQRFVGFDMIG